MSSTKDKIYDFVKKNPHGVRQITISKELGFSPSWVKALCLELTLEGRARVEIVERPRRTITVFPKGDQ